MHNGALWCLPMYRGATWEAPWRKFKKQSVKRFECRSGYFLQYGGQFEAQKEASRLIGILGVFVLLGIFLVLYAHFHSWRIVVQVMLNIPLALVGSVAAVWLTGGTFSVATLVGFITLTGIASRNGIMMISHYLHLMEHEGEQFDKQMIVRGSLERLVPVLMNGPRGCIGFDTADDGFAGSRQRDSLSSCDGYFGRFVVLYFVGYDRDSDGVLGVGEGGSGRDFTQRRNDAT